MSQHIRFVSAGAGSGKTYRITQDLQAMLAGNEVRPSGVIATTFTRLAATELRERVRQKLLSDGYTELAAQMGQALIGTVNGVCGELLVRFAFEAGLSPDQKVLEEEQGNRLFGAALETLLAEEPERIPKLNSMARRLGLIDDKYQPNWRNEVMDVASAARANNMSPDQIRGCASTSTDSLITQFAPPYASDRDLNSELLGAVSHAIANVNFEDDQTKGTANYIRLLRGSQSALQQNRLSWAEWVKLSKTGPTKKSQHLAEAIQIIAGDFEKHPGLHEDIREFCSDIFDLAANSVEAYQQLKARQGLLDFVDQEQRMYELLDQPHVKATLSDELQVLFVDEFQDTSPIQLALFMKLAALADKVIWVGDVKQAIYGFRGSDPELMRAALQGVVDGGGVTDVLPNSWRSRPALVEYANHIFVPTFSGSLSAEEVSLKPQRTEPGDDPAVICWHLGKSNHAGRAEDLAYGIQSLVDSGHQIEEKESGDLRPVEYGDIAVLCRTNLRLQGIATACANAGIPVAFKRPGLLETPEGALALACLRRVADRRDTLASAEIRTLVTSESPENWLGERIQFLKSGGTSHEWGENGDGALLALEALADVRKQVSLLTPREALELALGVGGVREAAISWGPTADHARHRLRNVDLMLEYAAKYEDQCDMLNVAATVPGLILWFSELATREEDWQAQAADGRAVTLVTHHGAKGLEWPVVIAVDLDANVQSRLWGLTVLQREEGFDMMDPLAGRQLRYWSWPFGKQSAGISVADRIAESAVGMAARNSAIEEIQRLLYVSLTRARDCLVIPLPARKPTGEWLDTLEADWLLPEGNELKLPDGSSIPTAFSEITAPDGWTRPAEAYEARWVQAGGHKTDLVKRNLSPSSADPLDSLRAGEVVELGDRIILDGVEDITALGLAVHGIIAAEINAPEKDSLVRAERILQEWGFLAVSGEAVLEAVNRFMGWARATFEPIQWHVEYPVTHVLPNGQVAHGLIDLLIETSDGWVIIDHKSTPRPRNEWTDIAESYSGQLAMYKAAVDEISGKPVSSMWIHLPVGGAVIPIGQVNGLWDRLH
ncbi:MAG: UvrD-helicase domain-containing protein [Woeseia sp.]